MSRLSSVEVHAFRSFQRLRVDGLGQVNLFVGANNAGKTSLLEAIELLVIAEPWALWRSPLRRGEEIIARGATDERPVGGGVEADISHLFFGHALERGVFTIRSGGRERRAVECRIVEASGFDVEDDAVQGRLPVVEPVGPALAVSFKSEAIPTPIFIRLSASGGIPLQTRRRYSMSMQDTLSPVHFLQPEVSAAASLSRLWDRIVLSPEEGRVVEALRIIEPRIDRIAFLGDDRRYGRNIFLKLSDSEQRLPLGSMGDGLKRLLALCLHLIPARGGCLFVDEIDTGLYFSVMADMWRLVIETAKRLDVQVFATTHSLDCVRALAWVREKLPTEEDVALHRVEKGLERTIVYSMDEIVIAAKNHVEVR